MNIITSKIKSACLLIVVFVCTMSCHTDKDVVGVVDSQKKLNDLKNDLSNDKEFIELMSIDIRHRTKLITKEDVNGSLDMVISYQTQNKSKSLVNNTNEINNKLGFSNDPKVQDLKNKLFNSLINKYGKKYSLEELTNSAVLLEVTNKIFKTKSNATSGLDQVTKLPCDDIFLNYEFMAQQDRAITEWTFKTAVFFLGAYEAVQYSVLWLESRFGAVFAAAVGGTVGYLDNVMGFNPIEEIINYGASYLANMAYAYTTNLGLRMMCECYRNEGTPCDFLPVQY